MLKKGVPPAAIKRGRVIDVGRCQARGASSNRFRRQLWRLFVIAWILFPDEIGGARASACEGIAHEGRQLGYGGVACAGMFLPACACLGTGIRRVRQRVEDL